MCLLFCLTKMTFYNCLKTSLNLGWMLPLPGWRTTFMLAKLSPYFDKYHIIPR